VNRRAFIAGLGGALARPFAAHAQQSDRVRRIAVLMGLAESDPQYQRYVTAFTQGLRDLGWVEGRNVRIDYRAAGGDYSRA
jgi:putative ABC transport system substrate-binding protein